jgi:predicted nucleic acid-binding protein
VATGPIEDDLSAAADLANTLSHPVYDCLYLAMAIRENTYVVTADHRFYAAVDKALPLQGKVRMLSDPT